MKMRNKFEPDSERIPIKSFDNMANHNYDIPIKEKKKYITKNNLSFLFIFVLIFVLIYISDNNRTIKQLNEKIKELEDKYVNMEKEVVKKKYGVAFVNPNFFGNGIGRLLSILSELLMKTGKYDVYLINEQETSYDFKHHKKVKREIQKKEEQVMKDFDEANDIDFYILNNDVSNALDIYKSFGKKVIGVFHGVFLSCVFTNDPIIYHSWGAFEKFDSFIHIIPDDYWVYKKLGFTKNIYIPNLYTFDHKSTPSSSLLYKNVLMVGRVDDIIKGGKYGIYAMAEILKEVPDALLTIVAPSHPEILKNLTKELKIEKSVTWIGFTQDISSYYLNTSVLLVTSVSESFPMVMNEGKAHGLPIVSFDIDYSPSFQKGVITVDMFNYTLMGREAAKLLKDFEYRKKIGREAKSSLDIYNNNDTIKMWDNLFQSLINGTEDYNRFRNEVEEKYYDEKKAKEHLEKHYKYGQQFNEHFRCHTFENFTTLEYLNTAEDCVKKNNTPSNGK